MQVTVAALVVAGVLHLATASAGFEAAVAGFQRVGWVGGAAFEQGEHRGELEGGAGLDCLADGVVVVFDAMPGFLVAREISDRHDVAAGHFEHDSTSPLGLALLDLIAQRFCGHILGAQVDCCHDVEPRFGFDHEIIAGRNPEPAVDAALELNSGLACEGGVVGGFDADAVLCVCSEDADGPACKRCEGLRATWLFRENESALVSTVAADERKVLNALFLGIRHVANDWNVPAVLCSHRLGEQLPVVACRFVGEGVAQGCAKPVDFCGQVVACYNRWIPMEGVLGYRRSE